jgi:hypothetical protein
MLILGILQQKFPFMAAMGDVIHLAGNEMPMRSSHLIFLSLFSVLIKSILLIICIGFIHNTSCFQ